MKNFYLSSSVYLLYKISNILYKRKIPVIPWLIKSFIRIVFSAVIPYSAEIGKNTVIAYCGLGTVIHWGAKIGENCIIQSGVTIGGTSHKTIRPIIGNNVLIGTGAKIIGAVKIGDNVVVGANAVVVKDIPSNCVVAGVPAKIIKENIDITNYI
jgi:serine O-acetyltransferase